MMTEWRCESDTRFGRHLISDSITVIYDKGKDNDATLRSKVKNSLIKTRGDITLLNQLYQELKKHKSITLFYIK